MKPFVVIFGCKAGDVRNKNMEEMVLQNFPGRVIGKYVNNAKEVNLLLI